MSDFRRLNVSQALCKISHFFRFHRNNLKRTKRDAGRELFLYHEPSGFHDRVFRLGKIAKFIQEGMVHATIANAFARNAGLIELGSKILALDPEPIEFGGEQ